MELGTSQARGQETPDLGQWLLLVDLSQAHVWLPGGILQVLPSDLLHSRGAAIAWQVWTVLDSPLPSALLLPFLLQLSMTSSRGSPDPSSWGTTCSPTLDGEQPEVRSCILLPPSLQYPGPASSPSTQRLLHGRGLIKTLPWCIWSLHPSPLGRVAPGQGASPPSGQCHSWPQSSRDSPSASSHCPQCSPRAQFPQPYPLWAFCAVTLPLSRPWVSPRKAACSLHPSDCASAEQTTQRGLRQREALSRERTAVEGPRQSSCPFWERILGLEQLDPSPGVPKEWSV